MNRRFFALLPLPLAVACADAGYSNVGSADMGDLGITAGGSQDIGYARSIIESGGIPRAGAFTAEGLFSEFDLPLSGDACDEILCPRAAATRVDPVDGSGPAMLVQLGFGTALNEATFERRPLNLSLSVDISGSMADGKLGAARRALHTLVNQLNEADTVSLVAFDNRAELRLEPTVMDARGRSLLDAAIDELVERGGTNIEDGLRLAFGEVAPDAGQAGVEHRVMLFTDAQPNIGNTDANSFLGMTRTFAASGIGLSLFGLGMDMGNNLANEISQVRGGYYAYLIDDDTIEHVFDEEFEYMVTPVAYDLEVRVAPVEGVRVGEAFGAPMDDAMSAVEFGASTLFVSSKKGGMGILLQNADGSPAPDSAPVSLARFDLSYQPYGETGDQVKQVEVSWNGGVEIAGEPTAADDLGVYKMGLLLDGYLALEAGAALCDHSLAGADALARIDLAADRLDAAGSRLPDEDLVALSALLDRLSANILSRGNCQG